MATPARDHISDLERHRLRLEEQIEKLRKSLKHWQTWDAEYEGLKEEIQGFKTSKDGPDPTSQDMIQLGKDFGGELVNEKEIKELLGKDLQRSAKQVVDLISRRQDYVQQNVKTVQKQVDAAEDKLSKVLIISNPSMEDEEGAGPLMDIREELDEEGNVLSSSVSTPGQQTPQIMEALRKAGITDLPDDVVEKDAKEEASGSAGEGKLEPAEISLAKPSQAESLPTESSKTLGKKPVKTEPPRTPQSPKSSEKAPVQAESPTSIMKTAGEILRKKSVSFAPDTKMPVDAGGPTVEKHSISAHMNVAPGSRVVELNENDEIVGSEIAGENNPGIQHAIIPEDESPEDAKLRREMLEYSLNEVGHVVAELDLYEGDSDDDVYEYEEEDSDIEEVEDEDEWGRSRPVITEEYKKKMEELEQKLKGAVTLENIGPQPEDADLETMLQQAQGVHRLVVRTDEEIPPALLPKQYGKIKTEEKNDNTDKKADMLAKDEKLENGEKSVRFAESVHVSPAPKPAKPAANPSSSAIEEPSEPQARPVADAIVERTPATATVTEPSAPAPPRKTSRFKASRGTSTTGPATTTAAVPELTPVFPSERTTPTGPPGRTLASSIVEKAPSAEAATAPDPDGLDPATLAQEVSTEYHRLRARMIQRQEGGFVKESPEEEDDPLMEEREDGRVRKVSRFRAARLKAEGLNGGGSGGAQ